MRHIKIWFPKYFTEAHRKLEEGQALVEELYKFGIDSQWALTSDCSFIFCGSTWESSGVDQTRVAHPDIPVVHYNWDLYPFQLVERTDYVRPNPEIWDPYIASLKTCRDIWVPSYCTTLRTRDFTGKESTIIKTAIHPWESDGVSTGDYAVDVVRCYPDFCSGEVQQGCVATSIPLVQSQNTLQWDEFRSTISNCKFMVSGQFEASTGGLTLLEGLWHGKPSLLSNSPRHGGVDYLGNRATYFQWDNQLLLRKALIQMADSTPVIDVDEARTWITKEYSNFAMAERMAKRFWELYDESN